MMDFDRKSSNSDDKAQTGRDPLMELARLFGGKPEDAASDNYTGTGYDEAATFSPLDAAYPLQDNLDDYPSYGADESAQEGDAGFPGTVPGAEEDLQTGGYYGTEYGDEISLPHQEQQAPGRYNPVSPDIFNIEDSGAVSLRDNKGEEGYPVENDWYDTAYPYEGTENTFADRMAYPGIGSEQEEETRSPEWQDQQYKALHNDEGTVREWPRAEPAWGDVSAADQAFADMFDDHGTLQQPPDEYLANETFVSNEDTLSHYEEGGAVYSDGTEPEPDRYAVYAENAGQSPEWTRPADSAPQVHVQNPVDAVFDDAFFENDTPEASSFETSDYETPHVEAEVYAMQERFPEGEDVFYPDARLDGKNADQQAEPKQQQGYIHHLGFQLGHSYSYPAHPVVQEPVVPDYGSYEEEFSYQEIPEEQNVAEYDAYAAGEETYSGDISAEAPGSEMLYQRVAEAFPDFDTATDSDNMYQYGQAPELGTVNLDETRVEETEAFDLPSVNYENEAAGLGVNDPLDQEFADIFEVDGQSASPAVSGEGFQNTEEDFFFMPGSAGQEEQGFSPHALHEDEESENINAVYDWVSPSVLADMAELDTERDFRKSGRKWLYGGLIVTTLAVLGTGAYMFFFPEDVKNTLPAVIHAEQGEVKIKPKNANQGLETGQDQAVYNRVEGNIPGGAEQKSLIDKTETPLDINKIDEQPPLATESSLDQSSVEKLVTTAAAQSIPIHVIPTVVVNPERKVVIVSRPEQGAMVLRPGRLSGNESDDAVSVDTGRADMQNVTASQVAAPAAQQNPGPKLGNMHENSTAVAEGGQVESFHAAVPVKEIVLPTVIPDKPPVSVQVAENIAEQTSMPPVQNATADNAAVVPNDFYMQISSQPSKEAAELSVREAKQRFGNVIGSKNVVIVPAAIPDRGTYYRVRVPVGERDAALNMCERYKQAGGSCFIGR